MTIFEFAIVLAASPIVAALLYGTVRFHSDEPERARVRQD